MAGQDMVTRIAAAALVAALSACGGLETPDLSRGAVAGRIDGALPGAYAYVYGAPQLRAALAADGTFEIDGVPVGSASVVLYDGSNHAEMVAVEVQGATRAWIDRTAAAMPLAGSIVAAARPQGGTIGMGASYTVDGTVLAGVMATSTALSVELWPLPGGSFVVWAALPGFLSVATPVTALGGATVAAEADLNIDPPDPEHGCVNKTCRAPLLCELADGWCYECLQDQDCLGIGETCVAHACVAAPSAGARQICDPCAGPSDCASGSCFGGDPAGPYCSQTCTTDIDCPAGFACSNYACVAPLGCAALTATFGAPCLDNGGCDDALWAGVCVGVGAPGTTGYCSAGCLVAADCSAAVGLPNCTAGACAP